jgi:hypothetical protein
MKGPTFFEGVVFALVASLVSSVLHSALLTVLTSGEALRLVVAGLALGYALYLLKRSSERVGRITAPAVWLAASVALWVVPTPLTFYLLAYLGMLWLLRSLYFYLSVLPALADLALNGLALAAALWAAGASGSLFLSVWSFFLTQALFVLIPPTPARWCGQPCSYPDQENRFQRAHRAAEAAVRKLSAAP